MSRLLQLPAASPRFFTISPEKQPPPLTLGASSATLQELTPHAAIVTGVASRAESGAVAGPGGATAAGEPVVANKPEPASRPKSEEHLGLPRSAAVEPGRGGSVASVDFGGACERHVKRVLAEKAEERQRRFLMQRLGRGSVSARLLHRLGSDRNFAVGELKEMKKRSTRLGRLGGGRTTGLDAETTEANEQKQSLQSRLDHLVSHKLVEKVINSQGRVTSFRRARSVPKTQPVFAALPLSVAKPWKPRHRQHLIRAHPSTQRAGTNSGDAADADAGGAGQEPSGASNGETGGSSGASGDGNISASEGRSADANSQAADEGATANSTAAAGAEGQPAGETSGGSREDAKLGAPQQDAASRKRKRQQEHEPQAVDTAQTKATVAPEEQPQSKKVKTDIQQPAALRGSGEESSEACAQQPPATTAVPARVPAKRKAGAAGRTETNEPDLKKQKAHPGKEESAAGTTAVQKGEGGVLKPHSPPTPAKP